MFVPNPSATTASQPQLSDIQQLTGLLSSLMPLLLRFQPQPFHSQSLGAAIPGRARQRRDSEPGT
jgi:hypothetical protein